MNKFFENRILSMYFLIGIAFFVLVVSLFNLTVLQASEYSTLSDDSKQRTLVVKGQRGQVLDRNEIPLAADDTSYNIEFYRDPSKTSAKDRAEYTQIIMDTINIIEENGGRIICDFSIVRDDDGVFDFDFNTTDVEVEKKREDLWRGNMYMQDEDLTPYECYMKLRDKYQIPNDVDYEMAAKVLGVWQGVQYTFFTSYVPVTIAQDVNMNTVATISSREEELSGMSAVESSIRTYPRGTTAAHIIGYTGRIQGADELETYAEKGYSSEDEIGLTGVESTMEDYLTANSTEKQGYQVVEVDSRGTIVEVLDSVAPESGDNVVLTIDLGLQQVLEEALEENINQINEEQQTDIAKNASDYLAMDEVDSLDDIQLAESGAAVVMDVDTGEVLAMASYPSYDPNKFVGGISDEDYAVYRDDERSPMFNKAVSSASTPGSIFKMVTGLAGLMEGTITVNTRIDDEGPFTESVATGMDAPKCWVAPNYSQHQNQTIVEGLKNSCNYFFMKVAYDMGIDNLNKWGENLGLTDLTGIQIPSEAVGQVGGQKILYDATKPINQQKTSLPYLVMVQLKDDVLPLICEQQDIEATDEELENCAVQLVSIAQYEDKTTWGPMIRKILREELGVSETISNQRGYHQLVASSLYQITWNDIQTAVSGMGQGYVTITPIAVARYISSLVNGGTVYNANIIKEVVANDGEVIETFKPTVFNQIDAPDIYWEKIKEGMREVVSAEDGGTAGSTFKDFEYKDDIGGKTGTAQVSQIDIENNSWFVCFAPYDKPEIAVVVFIPHGYKGSNSAYTAKQVVQYYLDDKYGKNTDQQDTVGADEPTQ